MKQRCRALIRRCKKSNSLRCQSFAWTDNRHVRIDKATMTKRATHREIPETRRASEHLDNERTFLAWVRTNVALISLGFVVARLSPTLNGAGATNAARVLSKTQTVGIVLIVFGALV